MEVTFNTCHILFNLEVCDNVNNDSGKIHKGKNTRRRWLLGATLEAISDPQFIPPILLVWMSLDSITQGSYPLAFYWSLQWEIQSRRIKKEREAEKYSRNISFLPFFFFFARSLCVSGSGWLFLPHNSSPEWVWAQTSSVVIIPFLHFPLQAWEWFRLPTISVPEIPQHPLLIL